MHFFLRNVTNVSFFSFLLNLDHFGGEFIFFFFIFFFFTIFFVGERLLGMEVSDGFFIFFSLLFFNETFTNVSLHNFLYVLGSVLVLENGEFHETFNFLLFLNKHANVFLPLGFFLCSLAPSRWIVSIVALRFLGFLLLLQVGFLDFFLGFG